jgi:tetratricopeptide (TPR) repeat protein
MHPMSVWLLFILLALVLLGWLVAYMFAQKPVTNVQQLIQQQRYAEAVAEADRLLARKPTDSATHLHRAEALKLLGRFDEAIASYGKSSDPAAREGIALVLAHQRREFPEALRLMQEQIAQYPQIQEFQQLGLAYIQLRSDDREAALRTFRDNIELLETRFRDDYTDPDPLLAETLYMFGALCEANGDPSAATLLRGRAAAWAPGSWFG